MVSFCFCFFVSQEGETFPVIHLHLTKSRENYLQYTGKLEYEVLMDFITSQTR